MYLFLCARAHLSTRADETAVTSPVEGHVGADLRPPLAGALEDILGRELGLGGCSGRGRGQATASGRKEDRWGGIQTRQQLRGLDAGLVD